MRSTFKLFLATAAIFNASAVFGSEEALSEGSPQPQGISTHNTNPIPTEEELSKDPDGSRERLIATAKNSQREFYLRQIALDTLRAVFGHKTDMGAITLEMGLGDGLKPADRLWLVRMLALFNAPSKAAPILELVLADPTASETQKTNATDQLAILRKRESLTASNSAATPSIDSGN